VIVHGGSQSLPYSYGQDGAAVSEATLPIDAQDWSKYGIKSLSLFFYGDANNTGGQLYVKINGGSPHNYQGGATDIQTNGWFPFTVDLTGVTVVNSLTIGVSGGSGIFYVDDIRLYPLESELVTPVQPDTANLAGYWNFDEGSGAVANDISGNGNNATLFNVTWEAGQIGSAVRFNGVDSNGTIPAAAWNSIEQQVTLSAWMYMSSDVQTPVNFGAYDEGGNREFQTHVVYDEGKTLYFDAGYDDGYDRLQQVASDAEYSDAWIHWAFVKNTDTGMMKIYRNGLLWASEAGNDNTITGVVLFTIGSSADGNNWAGSMDDLRLYNRELTPAEIAGLAGRTAPLYKSF